jgi:predicted N-formylglutamate amidohydrolase
MCAMSDGPKRLTILTPDDPPPVIIRQGRSPFVIVGDHAGRTVPRRLGRLGLSDVDFERHIAWDIGAGAVAGHLGAALDACVIAQTYSRLVIDCNRPLGVPASIVEVSDGTAVPGNISLTGLEREARAREIFEPYHQAIAAELDRRHARGEPAVLIAMHSFTPVFNSVERPWQVGMLYRKPALATVVLDLLRAEADLLVGDNEPYAVSDATDYTIPVHGERRDLPHTGIEIRQDLIADDDGQRRFAALLARLLPQAPTRLMDLDWGVV